MQLERSPSAAVFETATSTATRGRCFFFVELGQRRAGSQNQKEK